MTSGDQDITPAILLQHMQQMQSALIERIDRLSARVDGQFVELKGEIQRLERKIDTLTLGVDSIDARLSSSKVPLPPQGHMAPTSR
jgi:phage shock protein A